MASRTVSAKAMQFRPLTMKRWNDFERLFGKQGACSGCWCMWWRQTRAEFTALHGERNRRAMKRLVEDGCVPGILGYLDGDAIGWCSVAPREDYPSLDRSRVLKRVDDKPVWSIVCFFVAKGFRGRGVAGALIRGAVEYALSKGARIVEAYPSVPPGTGASGISGYMGIPKLYQRAGFCVVACPSRAKVMMRLCAGRGRHLRPR